MNKQQEHSKMAEAIAEGVRQQVRREPITDPAQRVFAIFEGECPTCGRDVRLTHAGGTDEFFADQEWAAAAPSTASWDGPVQFDSVIGSLQYECPARHRFTVERTSHGDWAA